MIFPTFCPPLFRRPLLTLAVTVATTLAITLSPSLRADDAVPKTKVKASARPTATEVEGEFADFSQWQGVATFIDHMVEQYQFDRSALEQLFRKTRYVDSAIRLIKPAPPGRPKNWQAYRARFVEPVRIDGGVRFWNQNADALARAEQQFGVPAEIIVAIIGVETVYGRNTGNFRVMDALTTLAFDYPDTPTRTARMAFFRGELENVLLLARDTSIDPFSLLGSYAGAIGLPQFMPGSIRQFAVDFDGDGKIDLRKSSADAIGSVANFLSKHGWHAGEPIVFPTAVSAADSNGARSWDNFIGQGLEAKFTVDELKAAGVTPSTALPALMLFGLIDLQNGSDATEYWLGAANFYAITQYNRSYFYAMSVVDLARSVKLARDKN